MRKAGAQLDATGRCHEPAGLMYLDRGCRRSRGALFKLPTAGVLPFVWKAPKSSFLGIFVRAEPQSAGQEAIDFAAGCSRGKKGCTARS